MTGLLVVIAMLLFIFGGGYLTACLGARRWVSLREIFGEIAQQAPRGGATSRCRENCPRARKRYGGECCLATDGVPTVSEGVTR